MLAFTEDLMDCLLCPMSYFALGQCVAFDTRKPYPVIQTFTVDSWESALEKSRRRLDEFASSVRGDEP